MMCGLRRRALAMIALAGLLIVTCMVHTCPATAQPLGGPNTSRQESGWNWPEPIAGAVQAVSRWQRQANSLLAREVRAIKSGEGLAAIVALIAIGLAYGVLHTLGPGHGKAIVAAYFLDRRRPLIAGVFAGGWVALTHTISAVVIVVGLTFLAGLSSLDTLDRSRLVELVGYGLITAIGLWRLFTALTGREHHHHHHLPSHGTTRVHDHPHDHGHAHNHGAAAERLTKPDAMLGLLTLAGFIPCTGSMIVMLFAMANSVLWVGIVATVAISLGMAVTLAAIGIATVLLRRRFVDEDATSWLPRALTVAAALLVAGFGGLMFLGAVARAA